MRAALIALAITVGVWLAVVVALMISGRRPTARELTTFLPNLVLLFRELLRDHRVPRTSKLLVAVGLLWFSSPIDLIPEFIPVAGPMDDAIVAALILRHIFRKAGPQILREHWRGGEASLGLLMRLGGLPVDNQVSARAVESSDLQSRSSNSTDG
jgi:uncharacterized membrane protein YkvA (DUF1232 family)